MKILLLEEQPLCQEVLSAILTARFVGAQVEVATSYDMAIAQLAQGRPDLVIADFTTGDLSAGPGVEGLVQAARPTIVIVLDGRPVAAHVRRARSAGARAYISKTSSRDLIDAAIGLAAAGGAYFPEMEEGPVRQGRGARALSPRQAEVLQLLLDGLSNAEIAARMSISVATVKLHVHAVLKALGARNRTELVLLHAGALQAHG